MIDPTMWYCSRRHSRCDCTRPVYDYRGVEVPGTRYGHRHLTTTALLDRVAAHVKSEIEREAAADPEPSASPCLDAFVDEARATFAGARLARTMGRLTETMQIILGASLQDEQSWMSIDPFIVAEPPSATDDFVPSAIPPF